VSRRIVYVTGTRADYGLMSRTLKLWDQSEVLNVSICVTGMHLLHHYGMTVHEIENDGLAICARIETDLSQTSGAAMAKAIAHGLEGMVDVFEIEKPDLVVVLGDRGEMLAGTLAAVHLNIPVVHIHGGERSGTIDESVRHAISKLAHYHFTSTELARERLINMGELPKNVFAVGAPGLDGLVSEAVATREELCGQVGFDPKGLVVLLVFHPVLQEAADAGKQMMNVLNALASFPLQVVCLMPNADAGGRLIETVIKEFKSQIKIGFHVFSHLARPQFISWMRHCDFMIGNSSSGIIEAATFGAPVVNIGNRQFGRERCQNVIDVLAESHAIHAGIEQALRLRESHNEVLNLYGDGQAGQRMLKLLAELPLSADVMNKYNAY